MLKLKCLYFKESSKHDNEISKSSEKMLRVFEFFELVLHLRWSSGHHHSKFARMAICLEQIDSYDGKNIFFQGI